MTKTLPNLLTFLRLAAAPGVALVFVILPRPGADLAALLLFVGAATTDWLDGFLARKLDQVSEIGRMLDPIADKAMVMTALAVVMMLSGVNPWMIVPAALIILREVAVSGLREHLAGRITVPVTVLAKWKTTVQMCAIAVLLLAFYGQAAHDLASQGSPEVYDRIMAGAAPDPMMARMWSWAAPTALGAGLALLWLAAALTVITGVDYFRRGLAHPAMKR